MATFKGNILSVAAAGQCFVNRSRSLAKEILSAFYDLRLVLFGPRPIALLALGFVMYGALITIRGLWIVPMFVERYALTLVAASNVALLVSVAIILGPAIAGHFDPGDKTRPTAISVMAVLMAATIGGLAMSDGYSLWLDVSPRSTARRQHSCRRPSAFSWA